MLKSYCVVILLVLLSFAFSCEVYARGGGHHGGRTSTGHYRSSHSSYSRSARRSHSYSRSTTRSYGSVIKEHRSAKAIGVARDTRGQIKRSAAAKRDFMRETGYPNGRPGYVVDHVIPLKRGGRDDPSNMQWQTMQDAKAKDKWE